MDFCETLPSVRKGNILIEKLCGIALGKIKFCMASQALKVQIKLTIYRISPNITQHFLTIYFPLKIDSL